MKKKLDSKSTIEYIDDFLTEEESQKLFDELKEKVPWTHGVYNMFGKPVKTPRLLYAMRDKDVDITKSYTVTDSMVWTKFMKKIKDRVIEKTGKEITYAQLNYYRNGDDYIGFHKDNEIMKGDIIASISLGAKRDFVFQNIDDPSQKHKMPLDNGSLLIMNEYAGKHNWKHSLPKMKDVGERINITFRPR